MASDRGRRDRNDASGSNGARAADELDEALARSLAEGQFWRFPFNYRPDYRSETGYLVQNADGIFALVGTPAPARYLEPQAPPPPVDDDDDEGDLDFEMM